MRQQKEHVGRFSISLPQNLIEIVDRMAERRGVNRSRLLADLVLEAQSRELDEAMAEGYRAMASPNREFAESAFPAGAEVMLRND